MAEEYYKAIIGILKFIGFNSEEIAHGIDALPDNGQYEPKELIIQVGLNALKWKKEHNDQ